MPSVDGIQPIGLETQSESKSLFGDKAYQIANVYAVLVGAVGIEPTTLGLKGLCSTTELRPCHAVQIL
jgi:hypothetical protein